MSDVNSQELIERYRRLIDITRDLSSTLDLSTLLNRIVVIAADLCDAEAASILLYDETNRQLYFEAASNLGMPALRGLIVPVDSSLAGWIVTNRQPVIISDTQKDPRHFGQIAKATGVLTTSLLGVPLFVKDRVIGALEAINKHAGQFDENDVQILNALGAQAAVAIENARLFQQSDLVSEMVHELRTPLSSLNAAAHLMLKEGLTDEQRVKLVHTMQRETQRLTEMTTAFLDLARLESGRTPFHFDRINPRTLLEDCVSLLRGKVEEKSLRLELDAGDWLPDINADSDKLRQVFINLLGNAIKYTPENGVIRVEALRQGKLLLILISDSGPGIPHEAQGRIFEKFFRVQSAEQMAEGTGLGLSISKRIVEAHGGQISFTSQENQGTRFQVSLPALD